ncbi:LysE family transporter [Frigidibacter sp. MR17.24]|uniref:LysE family transporter n=1 Tax=Frigidibacter sp. MR17.24 TaxID=3127345 RepID=UPI003012C89F
MTPAAAASILATIWFVHLLAAISPGPAVLMAARTGMTQGAARGVALAAGLALGACTWAAAAMFGLRLVFEVAPGLMLALRLAGAAYLMWLAVAMWRGARDPLPAVTEAAPGGVPGGSGPRSGGPGPRHGVGATVLRGLGVQLANPKPAVFFGAVFASLVPAQAGPGLQAAILAAVAMNEFVWTALVARVFAAPRVRAGYARLKAVIDRCFGGLLAALGLKLALS